MKRLLISTLSAAVSVGMVAPAFAYISLESQRSPYHSGRPSRRVIMEKFGRVNNRPSIGTRRVHYGDTERSVAPVRKGRVIPTNTGGVYKRTRRAPSGDDSGRIRLRRAEGRRFRRLNRTRKPDSDRYRTLNTRPNTRSLRRMLEGSFLPSSLVQTGQDVDRSRLSRRAIRGNRDRHLLLEISQSSR